MVEVSDTPITSLAAYLKCVVSAARLSGERLWFRGHGFTCYALLPSLYRTLRPVRDGLGNPVPPNFIGNSSAIEYAYPNFQAMLQEFKRLATPHLNAMSRPPTDEFEWVFLMQHYGTRTRLLDWSTDPLIALYFAVQNAGRTRAQEDDAAVFLLAPNAVNRETMGLKTVISLNEKEWGNYLEPEFGSADFPICVAPAHIDPRIIAQSSVFTLHGFFLKPLDDYHPLRPHIACIKIKAKAVEKIRDELEMIGYDRARVFPELSMIAERVLKAGEQRFSQWEPETDE